MYLKHAYIEKLYHSITRRILQVLDSSEGTITY